jgi:hypothetical protein
VFTTAVLTENDSTSGMLKGMAVYAEVVNVDLTGFNVTLKTHLGGPNMPTATADVHYIAASMYAPTIEIGLWETLQNQTPIYPPYQYYKFTLRNLNESVSLYIRADPVSPVDVVLYANWDGTRPFGNASDDCMRDSYGYPHYEWCMSPPLSDGTYYFAVQCLDPQVGTFNVSLIENSP